MKIFGNIASITIKNRKNNITGAITPNVFFNQHVLFSVSLSIQAMNNKNIVGAPINTITKDPSRSGSPSKQKDPN
jgi:hypothetical protein